MIKRNTHKHTPIHPRIHARMLERKHTQSVVDLKVLCLTLPGPLQESESHLVHTTLTPQIPTNSHSQASIDLAVHSYSPHAYVCGPDCKAAMTQSALSVGGLFFPRSSHGTEAEDRSNHGSS